MQAALKLTACVLPGHRIEIVAPELPEGTNVELIILPELSVTPVNGSVPPAEIRPYISTANHLDSLSQTGSAQETAPKQGVWDFIQSLPPSTLTAEDWERIEREIQEEKNSWGD